MEVEIAKCVAPLRGGNPRRGLAPRPELIKPQRGHDRVRDFQNDLPPRQDHFRRSPSRQRIARVRCTSRASAARLVANATTLARSDSSQCSSTAFLGIGSLLPAQEYILSFINASNHSVACSFTVLSEEEAHAHDN